MTDQTAPNADHARARPATSGKTFFSHVSTPLSRAALFAFVAIIVALIFAPAMVSRSMIQDLILIFTLITLAQCWNLLAGYAGLISVGQQAFVGLGGYGLLAIILMLGIDPLLAVLISAIAVALISIPVGFVVFRMQGAYFAVVTWVVAEVFRLSMAQVNDLGGGTGMSFPRSATSNMFGIDAVAALFDVRSSVAREIIIYWGALGTLVLIVGVAYWILRSRLGLALSAVRDGEVAASSVGVDITGSKFKIYIFAAFGAGLAGALYFLQTSYISPDAAFSLFDWTAYVIFIVIIGGIGTIEGPIIGAILFVLLQNTLSSYGPWYLVVLGTIGIVVMLVAPRGIWGAFSEATNIHLFPTRRYLASSDSKKDADPV